MKKNSLHNAALSSHEGLRENGNNQSETIRLNSTVEFFDLAYKRDHRIKIVLPDLADVKNGFISVFAPLSAALLGYRQGDTVKVTTNGRLRELRLKLVENL